MTHSHKFPVSSQSGLDRHSDDLPHPAPSGVTIYYWPCSLVLLARSLILERPTGPLSATLRIACREPYTIEVEGKTLQTRASLVAPKAERKKIIAIDSDIALFYLPLEMIEYSALEPVLGERALVDLPIEAFEPLLPTIRRAMTETVAPDEIKALTQQVVETITGQATPEVEAIDPRVAAAYDILDTMPLRDVSLDDVAQRVHLSPSRLRELFKRQMGVTIGEYARWRSLWRATMLWKRGLKLTDVAVDVGFHDLAHLDKTFNEVFGMNPSTAIDPRFVTLVNCEARHND